jgi:hypothetical protein
MSTNLTSTTLHGLGADLAVIVGIWGMAREGNPLLVLVDF